MINKPTYTIPTLQGTLAKRIKPTLQPNFAKEPFSPSRSNACTDEKRFDKNETNRLRNNNGQRTTRGNTQLPGVAFAIRFGTLKCKTNNI